MGAGGSVDPSGQARVNVREVLNAIFYVLWTGCQWKALPKDLPPRSTVWEYLDLWDSDGTLERIHHALYVEMRENAGREASPTTAWPQAPRSDGYNWPVAGRSRPPRQRTGPRRRRGSAPRGPTELPVHRAHHRRRRLSRAKDASRRRPHRQLGASDRAPLRPAPVPRAAEKMDRGAHLGLDQPLSSAGTRLRASRSQGGRVRPSRKSVSCSGASPERVDQESKLPGRALRPARLRWAPSNTDNLARSFGAISSCRATSSATIYFAAAFPSSLGNLLSTKLDCAFGEVGDESGWLLMGSTVRLP